MRISLISAATFAMLFSAAPAQALESYPAELSNQFVSWCTTDQNQPQTVCSCALNKAALEIPTTAIASFLSAADGGGLAMTTQGVGATTLQIVTTCAASDSATGTATGSVLESIGTSFGQ